MENCQIECSRLSASAETAFGTLLSLLGDIRPELRFPLDSAAIRPLLDSLLERLGAYLLTQYVGMTISAGTSFPPSANAKFIVGRRSQFKKSAMGQRQDHSGDESSGDESSDVIEVSPPQFDPFMNSIALLEAFNHARGLEAPDLNIACVSFRVKKGVRFNPQDNRTIWFKLSEIEGTSSLETLKTRLKNHTGAAGSISFFVALGQTKDKSSIDKWCPANCCIRELILGAMSVTADSARKHFAVMREDIQRDNDIEEAAMHGQMVHLTKETVARAVSGVATRVAMHEHKSGKRGSVVIFVSFPTRADILIGRNAFVGMCIPGWMESLSILDRGERVIDSTIGETLGHAWRGESSVKDLPIKVYQFETLDDIVDWEIGLEKWIKDEPELRLMWLMPYIVREALINSEQRILHDASESVLLFRGRTEIQQELGRTRRNSRHRPIKLRDALTLEEQDVPSDSVDKGRRVVQVNMLYILSDSLHDLSSCDPFLLQCLLQLEITHEALIESRRSEASRLSSASVFSSSLGIVGRVLQSIKYLNDDRWDIEPDVAFRNLLAEQQRLFRLASDALIPGNSRSSGGAVRLEMLLNTAFRCALLSSFSSEDLPSINCLDPTTTMELKMLREVVLNPSWQASRTTDLLGLCITVPAIDDSVEVSPMAAGLVFGALHELLLNALNFASEAVQQNDGDRDGHYVVIDLKHDWPTQDDLVIEIKNTCVKAETPESYWSPKGADSSVGRGGRLAGEFLRALNSATAIKPIKPETEDTRVPHTWKVRMVLPSQHLVEQKSRS